jgi:hypothetical protein
MRCRFPVPQPVALWIAHVACFAGDITHAPYSTVTTQYSAVQYCDSSAVQYSKVQCSAVFAVYEI